MNEQDSLDRTPLAEAILASMTEGLIVADMAGNVLDINPAALRLHDFQGIAEAQRHLSEFPDTFEIRSPDGGLLSVEEWPLARALRGETFTNSHVHVRRLDTGAEWWGNFGGTVLHDDAGRPLRVIVTVQDISALKRAEQEMRYVTGHARCLLWHGTVTQYEDGDLWWSTRTFDDAAAQAFCPLDLLPGEPYTDAWYRCRLPEGQQLTNRASRWAFEAGLRHYEAAFGCRGRDGVVRWFSEQVNVEPLRSDQSQPDPRVTGRWGVVGVSMDITERREGQRLLEESRQRYRSLFDYNPDAVFSFDLGGAFQSANAACQGVSGHTPSELLQITFLPLVIPEDQERVLQHFQLTTQGQPQSFECSILHKQGYELPLAVTLVPAIVDDTVVGVYGIAKDIMDRRRAEEALRESVQRQRAFLRDVLASVTEGRLRLCETRRDLPAPLPASGVAIALSFDGGLPELRHATEQAAAGIGFSAERWQDLVTSVGEAGMNAIVHAGGGVGRVCADGHETVQVWIEDQGRGIAVEDLPHATLQKGYTTAGSLGHGMKMMLQTADRVYLLTGPMGTTLALEQDRFAPDFLW